MKIKKIKFKFNKSKLKEIFRKLVVTYLFLFFCSIIILLGLSIVSVVLHDPDYTSPHCGGEYKSEEEIERRNCICLPKNPEKIERFGGYWECDEETVLYKVKVKFLQFLLILLLILVFPLILLFSPLYFFYDYWFLTLSFIAFYFYFLLKLLKNKRSLKKYLLITLLIITVIFIVSVTVFLNYIDFPFDLIPLFFD